MIARSENQRVNGKVVFSLTIVSSKIRSSFSRLVKACRRRKTRPDSDPARFEMIRFEIPAPRCALYDFSLFLTQPPFHSFFQLKHDPNTP
jgi:hypothetical protein